MKAQLGFKPSSDVESMIGAILNAKAIVVICGMLQWPLVCIVCSVTIHIGAGISIAAGIPSFRGSGGIYNDDVEGNKTEELFHMHALQVRTKCFSAFPTAQTIYTE